MEKETAMKILKELNLKSLFAERTALETIIPELAESGDERIKRFLIQMAQNGNGSKEWWDKCVSWLEKQGKQKQEWSEKDEEMAEDLIKGCVSAEKAHHLVHTSKEIADWL